MRGSLFNVNVQWPDNERRAASPAARRSATRNQPVLVAADIEDGHGVSARHSHGVSVRINTPRVLKVFPLCLSKKATPLLQWFG